MDIDAIWADQSNFVPAILTDGLKEMPERRTALYHSPNINKRSRPAREEQGDLFSPQSPVSAKIVESGERGRKRARIDAASPKTIRCPSPTKSPRQSARSKAKAAPTIAKVLAFDLPTPPSSSEGAPSARQGSRSVPTMPPPADETLQQPIDFEVLNQDIFSDEPSRSPSSLWWIPRQLDPDNVRRSVKWSRGRVHGPVVFDAAGWRDKEQRRKRVATAQPGFIFVDPSNTRRLNRILKDQTSTLIKSRASQPVYVYDIAVLGLPKCL